MVSTQNFATMVNMCAVIGCGMRSNPDTGRSFFRIPTVISNQGHECKDVSTRRRAGWLSRISRDDLQESSIKFSRVCDLHFVSGHPSPLYPPDTIDWLPSLNLGHNKFKAPTQADLSRAERAKSRSKRRKDFEREIKTEPCEQMHIPSAEDHMQQPGPEQTDHYCQTDLTGTLFVSMQDEINRLTAEKLELKKKLAAFEIGEEMFKGNDEKVNYYTGLPTFATLMLVFGLVSDHISITARSSLSKFQQVLMVLMRLRLNMPVQDLAYRFNTSTSTISRTFAMCVDVLYKRTSFLVKWPSREEIQLTMPIKFKDIFGLRVAVIMDCFEVFIDRSTDLIAHESKHHNTIKFLIGVTPQGSISFISTAWDGCASEKNITEESEFFDYLSPGDLVLAARGFDICDSVRLMCAEVKTPASMEGKKQLSVSEDIDTRKMASVRVHLERVLVCVRQRYRILNFPLPTSYLTNKDVQGKTLMDKMVHLCCALTNLGDTVVPFD